MQLFTGLDYLMISLANHYGLDKENFNTRIQWVKDNIDHLEGFVSEADDQPQYYANLLALRDTQAGKPTGYLVGFDACASGIQIMSALTRCYKGCLNTGMINDGERKDVYTIVTERMNRILKLKAQDSIEVTRLEAKEAIMTHFYGSTAIPEQLFGKGSPAYMAFYQALEEALPYASKLIPILIGSWQGNQDNHTWVLPDFHKAYVPVMDKVDMSYYCEELGGEFTHRVIFNQAVEQGLANGANIVHSVDGMVVRELNRLCNYNEERVLNVLERIKLYKAVNQVTETREYDVYMAFNAIDDIYEGKVQLNEIDPELLNVLQDTIEEVLVHPPFEILCVHDEYKCHANYMNFLRDHFNSILARLSESNTLEDILYQITGNVPRIAKGSSIAQMIRDADYAIC